MNRVAICCLAAAALALGCVADGPEPVPHRAGPGVWIETKDIIHVSVREHVTPSRGCGLKPR